jgi:hypothetical protein
VTVERVVRYRLMAAYRGTPYQAGVGPSDSEVTLLAAWPPPEEHGFVSAGSHWRKQVRIDEVEALWESRPVGSYHGDPCLVLDDLGDRLHIAYLGMDSARASQLGYWQVDRGVFEVVIPRVEVVDLDEERHEFSLTALMFTPEPPSSRLLAPGAPERPAPAPAPAPAPERPAPPPPERPAPMAEWPPPERPAAAAEPPPAGATAWHGSPEENGDWLSYQRPNGADSNGYSGSGAHNDEFSMTRLDLRSPQAAEVQPLAPLPAPLPAEPRAAEPPVVRSGSPGVVRGRRAARKPRVSTQSVFAELLDLAKIPRSSYAVDEEVPGAMCLVKIPGGFEVFSCTDDSRHEVRFFEDEEAAYFYLFGVLAAEAVRSGALTPDSSLSN